MKGLAAAEGSSERFRVVFSDMDNFIQTMLATRQSSYYAISTNARLTTSLTEANHYIKEGRLRKGNLVRLTSFNSNVVKGKK